ncbi:MAG: SMC-Scp complex subunit ScpB [Candidatus Terraquivivens tikiterensis]|uniref:SMC-Scp complex subunit ScpB n=1 Tax=Candidatus Terraquivivens tikiterensis TaxID=1980982 RepID=A0A2R7Y1N7_9ARCH|nr:MAG: SMC-Scp complex subunit ScpB [Candidatus Terraquivivens tikiterensis]
MSPKKARAMDEKNKAWIRAVIESLLYASDKPVELQKLMSAVGTTSKHVIKEIISEISTEYESSNHPFRIKRLDGDRYFLCLAPEYSDIVRRYVKRPLLSTALLKTLSFIAYHQPVSQAALAAARGKEAYKHVRQLIEKGLVEAEKSGRTLLLRTTQLFADYFNLKNNPSEIKKYIDSMLERSPDKS